MSVIKKIANKLLRIAEVIFIVMIVYCIYDTSKQEHIGNKVAGVIGTIIFIVLFAMCIGIEVLKIGYSNKCPSCRKWFALKKQGREYIGSEEISVAVSTRSEEYHKDGTKTGRYSVGEQYVPGVKETYHINYICKKCGKSCYKTEYSRHANV